MGYEEKYLMGFSRDSRAVLELAHDDSGNLIAVSTALPLLSQADILRDTEEAFKNAGFNPQEYFYIGEVIVAEGYRGQGIAKKMILRQHALAEEWGFKKFCLSTVIRPENDPQKPSNFQKSDPVWESLDYRKNKIIIEYEWPTIQPDRSIIDQKHSMQFWVKE
jgi:GNAT superfamily N-acetyltransferase